MDTAKKDVHTKLHINRARHSQREHQEIPSDIPNNQNENDRSPN